jgi:type IV secretion system protein VirB2
VSHDLVIQRPVALSPRALLLISLAFILAVLLASDLAQAATSGGGGMEWEAPLTKFADSIKGPVAFVISLLGIVVCGAVLIWGGEINEFVRRFIMLIMVISILVFASNILSGLFGVGAVIALGAGG